MVVQQMLRLCWAGMVALCAEAVIGEEAFVGVTVTVESGTNTLAQALADSGQTLGNADLLKLGAGTLDLGSNPGYTGNIHVKEGVAFAALTDAFGTGDGWTKIYDGAQLQLYTNEVNQLSFPTEQFIIEGTGPDGKGAIRCMATQSQNSGPSPLGNHLTLSGDALITSDTGVRYDLMGTTDLGGHTLTLKTPGTFSYEGSTTMNGNIVTSGGQALFPTQCKFPGDASNVFLLTNNATAFFCWSVLNNVLWTLDVADGRIALSSDGQDNLWNGPVILRKNTIVSGDGRADQFATIRFPKKVTGDGGLTFAGKYQELRLSNSENDFKGGIRMKDGRVRVDVNNAVPREGGMLVLTNSPLTFQSGCSVCAMPPAEFNGTGYVGRCTGTWKDRLVKSGDGSLVYESLIGSDLLDVQGGRVSFSRKALAGLNGGTKTYGSVDEAKSALTDSTLMLTNAVALNMPLMESAGWAANVLVTYDGYIWNSGATDVTWTWHLCIDDACVVWIDGKKELDQSGWTTVRTQNITLTPGPHAFAVRAYNGGGGSGASNANGAWVDTNGTNCNTKGLAVDRQARGETRNSDYYETLKDPGDGTLFTTSLELAKFTKMKFVVGTGIDLDGMPYVLQDLEGLPAVSNGTLTVARSWKIDPEEVRAGHCATSDGTVAFDPACELDIADAQWGTAGAAGIPLLTAEGGVEGLPTLRDNSSRYQRRLGTSADGRTLLLYASSGLMVIVR